MRRKIKGKKNGGKYEAEIRCKGVRHVIERRGMEKRQGGWRKTHTRSQRESSVKEADGARRIVPSSRLATKYNTNFTLVHNPATRPRATAHWATTPTVATQCKPNLPVIDLAFTSSKKRKENLECFLYWEPPTKSSDGDNLLINRFHLCPRF